MTIETETQGWRAAIVMVRQGGLWHSPRPAVFLFDTPTGWCWVEPSYATPEGASTFALHEREGQPERISGHWAHGSGAERIEVTEYDDETDEDLIGDQVRWFESYLVAVGRTRDEERARVRAELADAGVLR